MKSSAEKNLKHLPFQRKQNVEKFFENFFLIFYFDFFKTIKLNGRKSGFNTPLMPIYTDEFYTVILIREL